MIVSSVDKKLAKDKKLNTDVWYEEDTLNWVKASFKKKGNWEYRLFQKLYEADWCDIVALIHDGRKKNKNLTY